MKIFIAMITWLFASIISSTESVAKSTTEGVNAPEEVITTPDSLIWFIGVVLVALFTFIIIATLAKGAIAMSENIRKGAA